MKMRLIKLEKYLAKLAFFVAYIYGSLIPSVAGAATLNLSELPLAVAANVPPNVVVSMDDSGSMAWGYMPDSVGSDWNTRAYRSPNYNKVMYDPEVRYEPPVKADGSQESNANFAAAMRGFYYSAGSQDTFNLNTEYAAIYTHYSSNQPDLMQTDEVAAFGCDPTLCTDEAAHYYVYNDDVDCIGTDAVKRESNNCYDKYTITDAANYSSGVNAYGRSMAQEEVNFANWFQYYGIRGDSAKTALMGAFSPEDVDDSVRVGRQTFNANKVVQAGDPSASVGGVRSLGDAGERANFYKWIGSVPTSGGTPLRSSVVRAGEFYKTNNPYRVDPADSSSATVSCRVNTHLLVTDGFYNGSFTTPSNFVDDNADSDGGTYELPDDKIYTPGAVDQKIFPNSDTNESLADLTFHYWATDLFGDVTNDNVNPYYAEDPVDKDALTDAEYWNPANDPAVWQHMVSYMVAFGLSGTIPVPDATVYAALLAGNTYTDNSGTPATGWPDIDTNQGRADDVYHAGLNGRGGFFNAADPNELINAFSEILFNVQARQASASTVVADSGRISSDNLLYVARYNTGKWVGQLQAYNVSDGSEFDPQNPGSGCNAQPFGERCGEVWDAGAINTEVSLGYASREIITYNSSTSTSGDPTGAGVDFSWTSLNPTQQAFLNDGDGLGQQRVDYLRGDSSNEVDQGGLFRIRSGLTTGASASRFGPVFHASPMYVGNGVDASGQQQFDFPDDLETSSYSGFLSSISGRTPIIYVGGNDGLLHAINAESNGGEELFAYVPNEIVDKLPDLTKPTFQSGAFVDGPIAVQDTFFNSSWHTLLVGGLRAGGQGVYALDVTNPVNSGGSVDPSDVVLWEYSDVNDADMGYTFGEPQLVRSNYGGGKWVVIVANGYNSTVADGNVGSGKAVLFVLDPSDGSQIAKFEVGNGDLVSPSGLSSPVAVFADGDANADYAYAGDLDGNMWKFDLTSSDATQWSAAKLYSAGSNRPITGKPTVGNHPANFPGRIVYFGTGKYIESSDTSSTPTQAFYGVLDDDTCTSSGSACVSSGSLVTQSLASSAGSGNSTTSDNGVDWSTDKGWTLPLTNGSASAERVVGSPAVLGNVVIFLSIVPKSDPCESGGSNILYVLGRSNGGLSDRQIIDVNQDGVVNGDDTNSEEVVNVITIDNDVPVTDGRIFISAQGDKAAFFTDENSEGLNNFGQYGRIRWRQLK